MSKVTHIRPKDENEREGIALEVVKDDIDDMKPAGDEDAPEGAEEKKPQKLVKKVRRAQRDAAAEAASEVSAVVDSDREIVEAPAEAAPEAAAPAAPAEPPPAAAPAFDARVVIAIEKDGKVETFEAAHVKSWIASGVVKTIHRTLAENGYAHTAKIIAIKFGGSTQEDILAGAVYQPKKEG